MKTLILNSSNIISNSNNSIFEYKFPAGSVRIKQGQKLALASIQMYYSNFNITSKYNNNSFSYVWIDNTTVNVNIPDSFLDIDGINNYLKYTMVQNGHYYLDSFGDYVFLIKITINPSIYKAEIQTIPTSSTIATSNNWTIPTGTFLSSSWVNPNNSITPELIISSSNNFGLLLGFNGGSYPNATITGTIPNQTQSPSYTSTQVFNSSITPQITPLSSFVITCSLINNGYSIPNNLLYSFSPIGNFGEQFTISPNQYSFIDTQAGQYDSFRLQILDQNFRNVELNDPVITILLVITDPDEKI